MENAYVAPLCLEDLELDKYIRQCHLTECGVDDSKAFYSVIVSEKPWLFTTNPAIFFGRVSLLIHTGKHEHNKKYIFLRIQLKM